MEFEGWSSVGWVVTAPATELVLSAMRVLRHGLQPIDGWQSGAGTKVGEQLDRNVPGIGGIRQ